MERYVCIHGHFYQPPRENPWLEAIEVQDSAYPYHDWNERVAAECYAPNRASRILDSQARIDQIVNNYSKMSFNFGPTLLAWLEHADPQTYQAILAADAESRESCGGHGSALAQAYNHMILPLANRRDKRTQVVWGIRDFERRFGRPPEGMWLPETAVDLETLETLAVQGIKFTILSPYQAKRSRPLGGRAWRDVSGGRIDPTMAYQIWLPSGRGLALFFYDGPITQAVAFQGLLEKGEYLVGRLLSAFSETAKHAQLVHIATDGETYGHHQKFGDMALAYALHQFESQDSTRITNYGQFLELHPPSQEVQIHENSSWSCVHGLERWRSNCGCNTGGHHGWSQAWRAPLRQALDALRDRLSPLYEEKARDYFKDPWAARDAYLDVVLDRSPENMEAFFSQHARRKLEEDETVTALKLLGIQRHAMLMYTSCGWFFDEISGIETVQVMQYAGRAMQLATDLFGTDLESPFLEVLEGAQSNIPEYGNGRRVYERFVKPSVIDLPKVGAHYAVSSLFEEYAEQAQVFCFRVDREDYKLLQSGRVRLALGRIKVTSEITRESSGLTVGVVHLGDHNFTGGVRLFKGNEKYEALVHDIEGVFSRGDIPELIRTVDKNFGLGTYSLKLLFRDQQRKVLEVILDSTRAEAEALYRRLYHDHSTLARFLTDLGLPVPKPLKMAAEFLLNTDLRRAFDSPQIDVTRIQSLLQEGKMALADLDVSGLEYAARKALIRLAHEFEEQPEDLVRIQNLTAALDLVETLPFKVSLWEPQNLYYEVMKRLRPTLCARAGAENDAPRDWAASLITLGTKLHMAVPNGDGPQS
jgi:alpha-amylase/alpha-mannosidase (GH57 family)